jgi:hypothetical protein
MSWTPATQISSPQLKLSQRISAPSGDMGGGVKSTPTDMSPGTATSFTQASLQSTQPSSTPAAPGGTQQQPAQQVPTPIIFPSQLPNPNGSPGYVEQANQSPQAALANAQAAATPDVRDSTYFSQLSAALFKKNQGLSELGQAEQYASQDFQEALRRMLGNKGEDVEALREDMNDQGLFYSGEHGEQRGKLEEDYLERQTDAQQAFDRQSTAWQTARQALEMGYTIDEAAAMAEATERQVDRDRYNKSLELDQQRYQQELALREQERLDAQQRWQAEQDWAKTLAEREAKWREEDRLREDEWRTADRDFWASQTPEDNNDIWSLIQSLFGGDDEGQVDAGPAQATPAVPLEGVYSAPGTPATSDDFLRSLKNDVGWSYWDVYASMGLPEEEIRRRIMSDVLGSNGG